VGRTRKYFSTSPPLIPSGLKSWLAQLVADKPHRHGELTEIEIGYVSRAIEEIERLRAAEKAER
jgi:hypothetical protein